jgi:hypothetical protein
LVDIINYRDFWKQYLREHTKRSTRAVHYLGVIISGSSAMAFGVTSSLVWLAMIGVGQFALPWLSHRLLEKNRPATAAYPLWTIASDARMLALAVTGQLGAELRGARKKRRRKSATKKPAEDGGLSNPK